jgi:hypothetical protein
MGPLLSRICPLSGSSSRGNNVISQTYDSYLGFLKLQPHRYPVQPITQSCRIYLGTCGEQNIIPGKISPARLMLSPGLILPNTRKILPLPLRPFHEELPPRFPGAKLSPVSTGTACPSFRLPAHLLFPAGLGKQPIAVVSIGILPQGIPVHR